MTGPVIHGPAIATKVMLVGQAPGPHEGRIGKPFGYTAGKTMFRWFFEALGADEAKIRERIYIAAVARCFPGKAKSGGDRKPDPTEIEACSPWLAGEVEALAPTLIVPVGALAIELVLQRKGPLVDFVGQPFTTKYLGAQVDVICLPHPSGASTWHRMEPGKALLQKALGLLGEHPAMMTALR